MSAHADHALPPVPRNALPLTGRSVGYVGIDGSATGYVVDGRTGTLWTTGVDGQLRLTHRFGVRLRLPVHRLVEDSGDARQGLGDVVAGGYALLRLAERVRATVGVDALLPTGDRGQGLGQGSWALAPLVQATYVASPRNNVYARLSGVLNVSSEGRSDPNIAERRADTELRAAIGATYARRDWRGIGELRLQAPLGEDPMAGDVYVTAAP